MAKKIISWRKIPQVVSYLNMYFENVQKCKNVWTAFDDLLCCVSKGILYASLLLLQLPADCN